MKNSTKLQPRTLPWSKKSFQVFGLCLLGLALVISLGVGRFPLSPARILAIVQGRGTETETLIFFSLRLPRILIALVTGMVLGISGLSFQIIFNNPLATPDLMGVQSGASMGAALGLLFFSQVPFGVPISAFIGAFLSVAFALLLARYGKGSQLLDYIIAGVIVSAASNGVLMALKFLADPEKELAAIEFWTMGSLAGASRGQLPLLGICLLCFAILWPLRSSILILGLGDAQAESLGVSAKALRRLVIFLVSLAIAITITLTGPISFIALVAPHLALRLTKQLRKDTFFWSALYGTLLLVLADNFARSLTSQEIPISIFTILLGVPYLTYFLIRGNYGN